MSKLKDRGGWVELASPRVRESALGRGGIGSKSLGLKKHTDVGEIQYG